MYKNIFSVTNFITNSPSKTPQLSSCPIINSSKYKMNYYTREKVKSRKITCFQNSNYQRVQLKKNLPALLGQKSLVESYQISKTHSSFFQLAKRPPLKPVNTLGWRRMTPLIIGHHFLQLRTKARRQSKNTDRNVVSILSLKDLLVCF